MLRRACVVACIGAAMLAAAATDAHAYEFWMRARTIGQVYQLREYRLVGPDLFIGRRRITQLLALRIYDIGDLSAARRKSRLPDRGPRITWQSYLRIDHDFGTFANDRVALPGVNQVRRDALDVYPELAESVMGLDLMYGFLQIDGLFDDRVSAQVGRIVADDGWGQLGFDGAAVKVTPPAPVTISASGGLRVRASSPLGVAGYELDGTSGAGCREYVEGETPGTGSWQLVDRNRTITNNRLASDFELCPQRNVRQPTVAASVATKLGNAGGEIGYRRTWSETFGLIDTRDRLQYPDLGLYPNDYGQAPESGVNEERLHARAWGTLRRGAVRFEPYADVRFSLLHGLVDRADAGVRVRRGDHALEPAVEYFFPTFDGDSIFNAFSVEPTTDVRLGYQYTPNDRPWRGRASAWLRRYSHAGDLPATAGGADAGIEHVFGGAWRGRVDALWDDGWGGRRVGGAGDIAWRARDDVWTRGRVVVLGVHEDEASLGRRYVTTSGVASVTLRIAGTVGFHAIGEIDHDAIQNTQTRVIGVLDLAFAPDP